MAYDEQDWMGVKEPSIDFAVNRLAQFLVCGRPETSASFDLYHLLNSIKYNRYNLNILIMRDKKSISRDLEE